MLLWFDKNGVLKEILKYGPEARVGTQNFQIFAYFDLGADYLDIYGAGAIRFQRPDLDGSEYPTLMMTPGSLTFDKNKAEAGSLYSGNFVNERVYPVYIFDFSKVYDTSLNSVVTLLDTPGLWEATITLINSTSGVGIDNVVGLVKFNVEGSVSSSDDEETEIEYSVITNNISDVMATKMNKSSMLYVRYNANLLEAASNGTLPKDAYQLNSYVYDGTTKSVYQITSVTDNGEDYEYAEVIKKVSDDFPRKFAFNNTETFQNLHDATYHTTHNCIFFVKYVPEVSTVPKIYLCNWEVNNGAKIFYFTDIHTCKAYQVNYTSHPNITLNDLFVVFMYTTAINYSSFPVNGDGNFITSGGVYTYVENKIAHIPNPVTAVQLALDNGTMKIVSANVNSESALVGQALVSDGNGGVSWGDVIPDLSNVVTLDTAQTITGVKTFSAIELGTINGITYPTYPSSISTNKSLIYKTDSSLAWGDASDLLSQAQMTALNSGIDSAKVSQIATNTNSISSINEKIPLQATSENKLADKAFVNSSIATNTANFIGTFPNVPALINIGFLKAGSTLKAGTLIKSSSVINGAAQNDDEILDSDLSITQESFLCNDSIIKSGSVIFMESWINHVEYASTTTTSEDISIEKWTNNDYAFVTNSARDFATTTEMNAFPKELLTEFDYGWVVNGSKYDLYRFNILAQTRNLRVSDVDKASITLNTAYNRYKYIAETGEWTYEYTLNNSNFTANQWAAINSGTTAELVDATVTKSYLGDTYSNASTYAVGDLVIYNDTLYKCSSAIATAEEFNSAHWTATTINNELEGKVDLTSDQTVNGKKNIPNLYVSSINSNSSSYGLTLPDTTSFTANEELATKSYVDSNSGAKTLVLTGSHYGDNSTIAEIAYENGVYDFSKVYQYIYFSVANSFEFIPSKYASHIFQVNSSGSHVVRTSGLFELVGGYTSGKLCYEQRSGNNYQSTKIRTQEIRTIYNKNTTFTLDYSTGKISTQYNNQVEGIVNFDLDMALKATKQNIPFTNISIDATTKTATLSITSETWTYLTSTEREIYSVNIRLSSLQEFYLQRVAMNTNSTPKTCDYAGVLGDKTYWAHFEKNDSTYTGELREIESSSNVSPMTSITYSNLVSLKNAGTLIPGMKYRITDYTCTTTTEHTSSAGHVFDVIVTAISTNTLSEEAQAALHSGDTYFANSKLSAWKLWYSLENDTDRFAWADATNGKGVIYRMIDEFGNDCPYDFKNILFDFKEQIVIDFGAAQYIYERNDTLDANGYYGWTTSETTSYGAQTNYWTDTEEPSVDSVVYRDTAGTVLDKPIVFVSLEDLWTYTFEQITDTRADASLNGVRNSNYNCFGNVIKPYCYKGKLTLNFIAFKSSQSNMNLGAYFNTFENDCYYMIFKYSCYNNTFNNSCHHNIFNFNCSNNKFDNNCYFNKAESFFSYNSLGNNCYFNTFSHQCSYNTLNKNCYRNRLGYGSSHNTFDINNNNNYFRSLCTHNNLGKGCNNNEFGNDCFYINLKSNCSYIKTFDGTNVVNYVRYVTVDSGCNNINICSADTTESSSNYLQNVHICYGVANQTITVSDRNLDYEINYKMSGSTEVLL